MFQYKVHSQSKLMSFNAWACETVSVYDLSSTDQTVSIVNEEVWHTDSNILTTNKEVWCTDNNI